MGNKVYIHEKKIINLFYKMYKSYTARRKNL